MHKLLLIGAILGLSGPAASQQITVDGIMRTASLYAAIAEICPSHTLVDVQIATKSFAAIGSLAKKQGVTNEDMHKELLRRFNEVQITGPAQWCIYQKQRPSNRSVFPRRR